MKRLIASLFTILLAASSQAGAQEPPPTIPTDLQQQLEKLQADLNEDQQTFSGFGFTTLRLDNHWVDRLNMDRSSCLEMMKLDGNIASNIVNGKSAKLRLELLLQSNLQRTVACLFRVSDFLNLGSIEYRPTPDEVKSRSGAAVSLKWQVQIQGWVMLMSPPQVRLDHEIDRRLAEVDK